MAHAEAEAAPKLVRGLGLTDATMIVMGSMIGSGIFITSAESARLVGSPGWLLVAWALAGLMTVTGALCCAELAAMMPRAGGQYVFLREAYGPLAGFLFGWAMFLVVQTGHDRGRRGRLRPVPRRLRAGGRRRPLPDPAGRLRRLRAEPLDAAARRRRADRGPDGDEHAGAEDGTLIQNTFTFTKTAALIGLIVGGPGARAGTASGAAFDVVVVGPVGQRLGPRGAPAGPGPDRRARRWRSCWARR